MLTCQPIDHNPRTRHRDRPHRSAQGGTMVAGRRLRAGMRVRVDREVLGVGKASRLRRQQQEKERQRRGAPGTSAPGAAFGFRPDAGPRRAPADAERASIVITEAVRAVCGGQEAAYAEALAELATARRPTWA